MSKWKSNGDYSSPNEQALVGQKVVLTQGSRVTVGMLKYVRASTRGNTTLAVVSRERRPDGTQRRMEQPIWTLRKKPFTIDPFTEEPS